MTDDGPKTDFERAAAESGSRESLPAELWEFLRRNRKWWLLPILTALLLVGALFVLGSTGAAPLIYTLF